MNEQISAPLTEIPPQPKEPGKASLTIVEHVTHQVDGQQPTMIASPPNSERLLTDEMPFVVRGKATEEWKSLRLDAGEFKPSMIVLTNPAPQWQRYPTELQKKEAAEKVLELSIGILIRPGRTLRCEFDPSLVDVKIRCRKGDCFYSLTLVPG